MHPILFYLGPYPVYTYPVCIALGLLTLLAVTAALARRTGWTAGQFAPLASGVIFGAFIGARLSHMIVEPAKIDQLLDFYSVFLNPVPGNIVGLIVGGFLGGIAVRRLLGLPSLGNSFAFGLAAASVCWRVGCTCAGCCYGVPTDLPWAIHLDGADRHPTMIYEGLFNLALLAVLWRVRARFRGDNELLFFYVVCYAGFRFWLEFIRVYPQVLWGLTGIQLLCAAIVLWYAARRVLARATPLAPEVQP